MAIDMQPRARLLRFYSFYEKSKISDIDRLLEKVGDSESGLEQLMDMMIKKYGPEPMVSDPPGLRLRIRRFYKHYNPDKLDTANNLVRRTKRKAKYELRLMQMLINKYGDEPDGELSDDDGTFEMGEPQTFVVDESDDNAAYEEDTDSDAGIDDDEKGTSCSDSGSDDSDDDEELENFESRLTRFYQEYANEKVSDVPKLVLKTGNSWRSEEKLMEMLVNKYGPEPSKPKKTRAPELPCNQRPSNEAPEEVPRTDDENPNVIAGVGVIGGAGIVSDGSSLLRDIVYCPSDGMPPEFCEYLPSFNSSLPWLLENCPNLVLTTKKGITVREFAESLVNSDSINCSVNKRGGAGATNKMLSKPVVAKNQPVTIELSKRQKRKFITQVIGLDGYGIKLKDAGKALGKKFACGSSITKLADNRKSIDIQGDYVHELPELICELYPEIQRSSIKVVHAKRKP